MLTHDLARSSRWWKSGLAISTVFLGIARAAEPNAGEGGPVKVVGWGAVQERQRVKPVYPEACRAQGWAYDCKVQIEIDTHGVPSSVLAGRCPELFKEAAVAAAMSSRFHPYEEAGTAIPVRFRYMYHMTPPSPGLLARDEPDPPRVNPGWSTPGTPGPEGCVLSEEDAGEIAEDGVQVGVDFLRRIPGVDATAGTLKGIVEDEEGLMLPGAMVTLSSPALEGGRRQVSTDDDGAFRFDRLPPGRYTLVVQVEGMVTVTRSLEVQTARMTVADVTLRDKIDMVWVDAAAGPVVNVTQMRARFGGVAWMEPPGCLRAVPSSADAGAASAASDSPCLILNGTPHFATEYASLHAGTLYSSIPGVSGSWFAGVPVGDVTVTVDGVRWEQAGFMEP